MAGQGANDTIVAVATPPGRGGVGVVRLSGPDAQRVLRALLRATPADLESRRLHHAWLPDPEAPGRFLDEVLYVVMAGPNSYTGEDVVEVQTHGSPLVLQAIVAAAIRAGARAARPGEFTRRAFLSGRLDLTQAEAVVDLIEAQTGRALRAAAAALRGRTREACEEAREALADRLALVEAWIDFPEEDLPAEDRGALRAAVEDARGKLRLWLSTAKEGRALSEGVRIALAGRPNAGKSSLMNALAREDRAIVAPEPGTTRDFLETQVSIRGFPVTLVDTAGIREASGAVEGEGVRRSRAQMARAEYVLLLVDGGRPPTEEDRALYAEIDPARRVLVRAKGDLALAWDRSAWDAPPERFATVSALAAPGVAELEERLAALVAGGAHEASDVVVASARQQAALEGAAEALERALGHLARPSLALDLLAADLRAALDGLGDLVGRVDAEAILDRVFSRFCIGK